MFAIVLTNAFAIAALSGEGADKQTDLNGCFNGSFWPILDMVTSGRGIFTHLSILMSFQRIYRQI